MLYIFKHSSSPLYGYDTLYVISATNEEAAIEQMMNTDHYWFLEDAKRDLIKTVDQVAKIVVPWDVFSEQSSSGGAVRL